jgi:hypothetical protein
VTEAAPTKRQTKLNLRELLPVAQRREQKTPRNANAFDALHQANPDSGWKPKPDRRRTVRGDWQRCPAVKYPPFIFN